MDIIILFMNVKDNVMKANVDFVTTSISEISGPAETMVVISKTTYNVMCAQLNFFRELIIDLQTLADDIAAPIIKFAYDFYKMESETNMLTTNLAAIEKTYSYKKFYLVHL